MPTVLHTLVFLYLIPLAVLSLSVPSFLTWTYPLPLIKHLNTRACGDLSTLIINHLLPFRSNESTVLEALGGT